MKHVFTVLSSNWMLFGEPVQMTYASFENETDAFEFYMSLMEEGIYVEYLNHAIELYPWFMARLTGERNSAQVTHADVVRGIWAHIKSHELDTIRRDLHIEKTVLL
jgi:hypothetical protein